MITRILFFLLFSSSCAASKGQGSEYTIKKIKTVRNYYVIYVIRNDSTFKVVSKREEVGDCNKIKKNESYPLNLSKVRSIAGPEIDCFSFDEETVICKEPDIELTIATNLNGLCITK